VNLDFDTDRWARVRDAYRRWWAGELGRPLINLTLRGRDPGRPEPRLPSHEFTSLYDLDVPAEAIVDRWLYDLECRRYVGDAFPQVWPNFGPGVIAALLGLPLHNGEGTVWFAPTRIPELTKIRFEFDSGNRWYRRLSELYQVAAERFEGLVHIGMTDLGGNLDVLSCFRPGEHLLLDLLDDPRRVEALTTEVHGMWWQYFEQFNRLIQAVHPGYTAWTPIYSEDPYYMLQCDFSYMIGPDMFEQFVKPELVATCSRLANPFYHLDGPGQLTHLDALLEIEALKGVQWVPGAGQPGVTRWPEIYRKIRAAGKRIQFFTNQDERGIDSLDILADQLGGAEGIIMIGEVANEDEPRVRDLLKRYDVDG